ncbi:unnamed protein product [Callosobruchus maculatus]|nr:unnamed protein product [Callosobruchus maculatus]
MSHHVQEHPEQHSLIPVPNTFIIPGGRFKEFYYWDTYWIVKGLLLSDMLETARGMVENLLTMVERFGFVPNGGRIYYLNRSQPPVLTLIMWDYVKVSQDYEFLQKYLHVLDKEMDFWLTKRLVQVTHEGVTYNLAHYDSESDTPRPESYIEDLETCAQLAHLGEDHLYECYTDLKSGAESGWDFSSRWLFAKDGSLSMDLKDISTRRNVPADLNAFLYKAFHILSKFCKILHQEERAEHWEKYANEWQEAINKVLYNEEDGVWYDYDLKLEKHRRYYFASNLTPLWAGAVNPEDKARIGGRCAEYLLKQGIRDLRGGVPMSMYPSGQQWDYPNAWSPYQNLVIIGLHKSNNETAQELAKELAHKWVNSNVKAYHENKVMFEKYSAAQAGQFGGGGEYQIQSGFGWSNGCVLELIHWYFRSKTRKYQRW